jgi:hypothetical protein
MPPMPSGCFVSGIPLPRVAPFDFISIRISIPADYIYMAITFHFYSVQIGLYEKEHFEHIYALHDECWLPQLVTMLNPVQTKYSLQWDVEYDESNEIAIVTPYSNSKSRRYLCWQRRRLDIIFDLEMVLNS